MDRFTGSFLAQHIGAEFHGQISGVTRFGLFINLEESGADGLVPIRSLPDDFYIHDEEQHALIGRRRGIIYRLGAPVSVRIKEADGVTGSSIFELTDAYKKGADILGFELKKDRRNRVQERDDRPKRKKKFKPRRKGGKAKQKNKR